MEYLIKIVIVCARKVGWARQRNRRVMTYKLNQQYKQVHWKLSLANKNIA